MRIIVRNNDPIKAYKVLMKKAAKENFFEELRRKRFYLPKSERKRQAHKKAVLEQKRKEAKQREIWEKQEQRQLLESKKKARQYKKQMGKRK